MVNQISQDWSDQINLETTMKLNTLANDCDAHRVSRVLQVARDACISLAISVF